MAQHDEQGSRRRRTPSPSPLLDEDSIAYGILDLSIDNDNHLQPPPTTAVQHQHQQQWTPPSTPPATRRHRNSSLNAMRSSPNGSTRRLYEHELEGQIDDPPVNSPASELRPPQLLDSSHSYGYKTPSTSQMMIITPPSSSSYQDHNSSTPPPVYPPSSISRTRTPEREGALSGDHHLRASTTSATSVATSNSSFTTNNNNNNNNHPSLNSSTSTTTTSQPIPPFSTKNNSTSGLTTDVDHTAALIRRLYERLEEQGVDGDGWDEGRERSRDGIINRVPVDGEPGEEEATARRERLARESVFLPPQEEHILRRVDR
ncbi:hypothetical protein T439DRAFT_76748 [Meredithblackwellia eburnea MCA 4105]